MSRCASTPLLVSLALLLLATFARAEEDRSGLVWMSGDEIRSEFSGRKLDGLYPSQQSWSETIHDDGID